MPGAINHIGAALACLTAVHLIHFKWEYSLSIFIGNLLPDVLKFGLTAIRQGTLALFKVKQDGFYFTISNITSSYAN